MTGCTSGGGGWDVVSEVSDSMFFVIIAGSGDCATGERKLDWVGRGGWGGSVMLEDKECYSFGWKPLRHPARRDIIDGKKKGMINSTHQFPSSSPSPSSPSSPQTE